MTPDREKPMEARARRYLESYLAGREQGGHPPLSPAEIAETYQAILSRVERQQEKAA